MAATPDGDPQVVLTAEADGSEHIGNPGGLDDQHWPAIVQPVPFRPGVVVAVVIGQDRPAPKFQRAGRLGNRWDLGYRSRLSQRVPPGEPQGPASSAQSMVASTPLRDAYGRDLLIAWRNRSRAGARVRGWALLE
jgi:hypothetical protein